MPLAVLLAEGDDMGDQSWSHFVRRPLLPGDGASKWVPEAAITWRVVEWARFSSATDDAILFARSQYRIAFSDALGRAIVHVDQTDDDAVTETLVELRDARGTPGKAVADALRLRFHDNGIGVGTWQEIEARVDAENIGKDEASLRAAFRREISTLCQAFGVPRSIVFKGMRAPA
jgi:hypothetical protein